MQIEQDKLRVTEQLVIRTLDSAEARELVASLPTADTLLTAVDTTAVVRRALEGGDGR